MRPTAVIGTARIIPVIPHTEPHTRIASMSITGWSDAPLPRTIGSRTSLAIVPTASGMRKASAVSSGVKSSSSATSGIGRQTPRKMPTFGTKLSANDNRPKTSQTFRLIHQSVSPWTPATSADSITFPFRYTKICSSACASTS